MTREAPPTGPRPPASTRGGHPPADGHGHGAHHHDRDDHRDHHDHDEHGDRDDHDHAHGSGGTITVAVAAVALGAGYALDAIGGGGGIEGLEAVAYQVAFAISIVATATVIVPGAWSGLVRDRTLGINALMVIAVAAAVALGDLSEGATVAFLFVLGEAIEEFTFARTRGTVSALLDVVPAMATVVAGDGTTRDVAVREIAPGSRVAVRPGGWIPIDGIVREGAAAVNQAPLTGESLPVDRGPGDEVLAGTVNLDGYLGVETTRAFDATAVASIVRVAESALTGTTRNQRLVQRFARWYTPAVVALAVVVGVVTPLALGEPVSGWFGRALVLVLVACPCALLMAAPVAVVAAVGNASRHGVVIRSAGALEAAGTVDAVGFDKTGTLTHGSLDVEEVVPIEGGRVDASEVLGVAAAVEARSEHPVGIAIVRAAAAASTVGRAVEGFRSVAGSGVGALVDGRAVVVGRPAWIRSLGTDTRAIDADVARHERAGRRAVAVAAAEVPGGEPRVIGTLAVADRIRPEAAEAVAAVRAGGVRVVRLVSGDAEPAATSVATAAGIALADVRASLMPDGKVAAVRELEALPGVRAVAIVGDGINDAPALAAAAVGIAMGTGSAAIARDAADVTIVADDLRRVAWFLALARRTRGTIAANVALALGIKLVVLVLATVGYANLWLAIAADTGATVVVALNGARLLGWGSGAVARPRAATAA